LPSGAARDAAFGAAAGRRRRAARACYASPPANLVAPVELGDEHVHAAAGRDLDAAPDHVGVDRQLAPAAVDEHRERDPRRPAEVRELVEGGAHRAAGVEHVVDDHHARAVDAAGERRAAHDRARADRLEVVAVERDVERAERHLDALGRVHRAGEPLRDLDAAALDPDEHEPVGAGVELDDLVGHALDRAGHRARVEQAAGGGCHGRRI
jgi:hypothetical protein